MLVTGVNSFRRVCLSFLLKKILYVIGPCSPPDCDNPACHDCQDCDTCSSGGPEDHPCVTTAVIRQCTFSQGVTARNPFQVMAKVSVVYFNNHAYAWVNYAANSVRSSLQFVNSSGISIFSGQSSLPTQPGFGVADGSLMFYETSIFGPMDWAVLKLQFDPAVGPVYVQICVDALPTSCSLHACAFGPDRPVLTANQGG